MVKLHIFTYTWEAGTYHAEGVDVGILTQCLDSGCDALSPPCHYLYCLCAHCHPPFHSWHTYYV